MIAKPTFEDKFIAFIDILGFKELVAAAEAQKVPLTALLDLLGNFRAESDQQEFARNGYDVCPGAPALSRDVAFRATQVSDSLVLSAEVSPAGVANIIARAWRVAVRFMEQAILLRGYITRGSIYHHGSSFLGSGYLRAYRQESEVAAFSRDAGDTGTPFVELDAAVVEYVRATDDVCVKQMLDHCTATDGTYTAIFPFRAMSQSFIVGGFYSQFIDYRAIRAGNIGLRGDIARLKEQLWVNADMSKPRVVAKVQHYAAALEQQLQGCDVVDAVLDQMGVPRDERR